MRILLTNDDGIRAPGIVALHQALQGLGEIVTIAPLTVQSASGHGITFDAPLMCEDVVVGEGDRAMRGVAVDGRPADCVKVALRAIWQERFGPGSRPDLTISGMNSGANVGINVLYSGTVAAAVESAFLGVPAIAVSLHLGVASRAHYARAAAIGRAAVDRILEHRLDDHEVINVNVPRTESEDAPVPELRVVGMNAAAGSDTYERRESPHGRVYYWPKGDGMEFVHTAPESDVEALREGFVTVTPLSYVMDAVDRMQAWRERLAP